MGQKGSGTSLTVLLQLQRDALVVRRAVTSSFSQKGVSVFNGNSSLISVFAASMRFQPSTLPIKKSGDRGNPREKSQKRRGRLRPHAHWTRRTT